MLMQCSQAGIDPIDLQVQFNATPGGNERLRDHPGQYHLPSAPEVALLMPRHVQTGSKRQIVCDMRNSTSS